ncbi:MAG: HlyC/CorC family transporter [Anaerolineaceae bacterium]|nr:HlyC/CorC family transporter [Anaerolineaceae bacterium]
MPDPSIFWIMFVLLILLDITYSVLRFSFIHLRIPALLEIREQKPIAAYALKLMETPRFSIMLRMALMINHALVAVFCYIWARYMLLPDQPMLIHVFFVLVFVVILLVIEYSLEALILPTVEKWALRFTWFASIMDVIFWPLTQLIVRLVGTRTILQRNFQSITDDELKSWVQDTQGESSLEDGEREMIYSILNFSDTLCREIMVPRIDVSSLEVNTSIPDAIQLVLNSGHSRLPVYEESIKNIVGLLYAKELLRIHQENEEQTHIRDLLRPAYFVPEAKKVDELLKEMQARGVHLSIVVDEYGGMAGLVTLEDIVEEIVGEIRDEYDESEELEVQKISDDEFLFNGRIDLDAFNELLDTDLTKDVADSLGGFVYSQIGQVPAGGEEILIDHWTLNVEKISGRRVHTVRAVRRPSSDSSEEEYVTNQ